MSESSRDYHQEEEGSASPPSVWSSSPSSSPNVSPGSSPSLSPSSTGVIPEDTMRCAYPSKRCERPRALKANGQFHRLCESHRARANENQLRWNQRRRSRQSELHVGANSRRPGFRSPMAILNQQQQQVSPTLVPGFAVAPPGVDMPLALPQNEHFGAGPRPTPVRMPVPTMVMPRHAMALPYPPPQWRHLQQQQQRIPLMTTTTPEHLHRPPTSPQFPPQQQPLHHPQQLLEPLDNHHQQQQEPEWRQPNDNDETFAFFINDNSNDLPPSST